MGQAAPVGLIVVIGAGGENPEFIGRQGLSQRVVRGEEQQVEIDVEDEPAPVADLEPVEGYVPAVAHPDRLGYRVAVENAVQHALGNGIPAYVIQRFADKICGHLVAPHGAAGDHLGIAGHHCGAALRQRGVHPVVLEQLLVDLVRTGPL